LFEQAGSSLNIYTDRSVDRHMFGFTVPASVFQSANAIFIIIFAPILAMLWTSLGKRNAEPSTPAKFGLAMINLGAGFLVLVFGAVTSDGLTPVMYIFLIYLLHTLGELCLSPVGLSAMSRLAVPRMAGLIMGTWFFAQAAGNFLAGVIASMSGGEPSGSQAIIGVYQTIGWAGVGVGVFLLLLSPLLRRLMHEEAAVAPRDVEMPERPAVRAEA
jgi:POT family proton-dependent oligopeptide transporter